MGYKRNQKYLETNKNGNTTHQNLWDAAEAVLREKFIVINAYIRKKERSQIHNLTLHLQELEKEEQAQSCQREEINLRAEINETETRKTIRKINKIKGCLLEKMNRIDTFS